jgi:hypothetical protein
LRSLKDSLGEADTSSGKLIKAKAKAKNGAKYIVFKTLFRKNETKKLLIKKENEDEASHLYIYILFLKNASLSRPIYF